MSLADEKYVSCATFRKSGAAVPTPTWIVPVDQSRVGFWTSSASGKAKRLRNNPTVQLTPSDGRGRVKPAAASVTGTAVLVTEGPDFDAIQRAVKAKYGAMVRVSRLLNTIGHLGKGKFPYGDVAVVIAVDENQA